MSGGTDPLILNSALGGVVSFTSWLLHPLEKSPRYLLNRDTGWVPQSVWTLHKGISTVPAGNRTAIRRSFRP